MVQKNVRRLDVFPVFGSHYHPLVQPIGTLVPSGLGGSIMLGVIVMFMIGRNRYQFYFLGRLLFKPCS